MDISQISTDLMHLVGLSDEEDEELPLDLSEIKKEESYEELKDKTMDHDPKRPSEAEKEEEADVDEAAADKAPKLEPAPTPPPEKPSDTTQPSSDTAKPATVEKQGRNTPPAVLMHSPITATSKAPAVVSPSPAAKEQPAVVSPSPAKEQARPVQARQDSGKLMYSSEVYGATTEKTKKKSWFAKRKSKTKSKKPLRKLSEEAKVAIYHQVGKRPSAKTKAKGDGSEIPTEIKLKKITKPPILLPNVKEVGPVVGAMGGRDMSFADSVSTLSHHVHDETNWLEQGMSSLLNNVFGPEREHPNVDEEELDGKMVDALLMGISKEEVKRKELQRPTWKAPVAENPGGATGTNPTDSAERPSPRGPDRGEPKPTTGNKARREESETAKMESIPEKKPAKLAINADGKLVSSSLRVGQSDISDQSGKDQESNTETGTDFSESDVKHSQTDTVTDTATWNDQGTYDNTQGSLSTAKDGTWLELGVIRMLDGPFSIGLGEDVDDDVFDDLDDDDDWEFSEIKPSSAHVPVVIADTSEDTNPMHGLPKFRYESPAADSKKQDVANVKCQAKGKGEPPDRPSATGIKPGSPQPAAEAGSGWFGQGMPSMLDLVALMSQDEDDTESADPLDFDPSMHKRKHANGSLIGGNALDGKSASNTGEKANASSNTDEVAPIVDGNTFNNARPRAYSAPGAPELSPKEEKKENTSLFSELYKALSYDGAEADTSNVTKESSLPSAKSLENRTITGLTAVTGASVFSGLSAFGTPMREPVTKNADVSQAAQKVEQPRSASPAISEDEKEQVKIKSEPKQKEDKVNVMKPSEKGEVIQAVVATLTRPRKEEKEDRMGFKVKIEPVAVTKKPRQRPLWKAVIEPKSGRTYYFHRLTRQTTWTKPDDFDEKQKPSMYWDAPTNDAPKPISPRTPKPEKKLKTSRTECKNPVTKPAKTTGTVPPPTEAGPVEDENVVGIVDYKSYDPTDALQVHRSHSHRDVASTEKDQIEAVADGKRTASNGSTAHAVVVKSSRSSPTAEMQSDDDVVSPDENRPDSEQAGKDPSVEKKKPMRKLLSWRRKPTAEREKAVVKISNEVPVKTPTDDLVATFVSTDDESREPCLFASKLVAEVEERLDPTSTDDHSHEREVGTEPSLTSSKKDTYVLSAEGGFERVLSRVVEEPRIVGAGEEESVLNEKEAIEEKVVPTVDVALDKQVTLVHTLGGKKDDNIAMEVNSEPKRRGLLRRFKSKSQSKLNKEQAAVENEKENGIVPEKKEVKTPKSQPLKFSVFAEIDTERSLSDLKDERTGSERTGKEDSPQEIKKIETGAGPPKMPDRPSTRAEQEKPEGSVKRESPSSVMQFDNVDADETPTAADQPKPRRKTVWKSVVDPASGRTYYYHRLTRKTTWTKPDDFDEPVKSTKDSEEKGDVDRECVKCNLDERFAATEEDKVKKVAAKSATESNKVAAKATKPKQKESGSSMLKRVMSLGKISKSDKHARASKKTEDTKKPVSSESVNHFVKPPSSEEAAASSSSGALLGTVVDSHAKASSLIQEELQRVSKLFSQTAEGLVEKEPHVAMSCVEVEAATVDPTNASSVVREELEKVAKLFNQSAEQLAEKEPNAAMTCLKADPNVATASLEAAAAKVPLADKEFVDAPDDELEHSFLAPADEVTGSLAPGSLTTGSSATKEEEQQQQLTEQKLNKTVWGDLLFW